MCRSRIRTAGRRPMGIPSHHLDPFRPWFRFNSQHRRPHPSHHLPMGCYFGTY
ncbi:unnamed protein product [Periconia digitata]|uniref:Uncharacterized protein n=1 Tax=Periconia digitata TaxID=1303443 RepID=A0A9W4XQB6_9PLEO|nr:unnamed protein product [Periconia digitata]